MKYQESNLKLTFLWYSKSSAEETEKTWKYH